MSEESSLYYADQMKFIVATMTKDYQKAAGIARSILKREPNNTIMREYLSVVDRKIGQIDADKTSDSNTDSDSSDSDGSETSDDETVDSDESDTDLDPLKFCQQVNIVKPLSGTIDAKLSRYTCKSSTKPTTSEFNKSEGLMFRVLPIKLNRKIS